MATANAIRAVPSEATAAATTDRLPRYQPGPTHSAAAATAAADNAAAPQTPTPANLQAGPGGPTTVTGLRSMSCRSRGPIAWLRMRKPADCLAAEGRDYHSTQTTEGENLARASPGSMTAAQFVDYLAEERQTSFPAGTMDLEPAGPAMMRTSVTTRKSYGATRYRWMCAGDGCRWRRLLCVPLQPARQCNGSAGLPAQAQPVASAGLPPDQEIPSDRSRPDGDPVLDTDASSALNRGPIEGVEIIPHLSSVVFC